MSVPIEPRSYAPKRRGKTAMAKLDMPEDPDNASVGDAIRLIGQVHKCVEDHRSDDKRDHTRVSKRVGDVERRVGQVDKKLDLVMHAIGIDARGKIVRKTFVNMGQLEFVSKVGGAAAVVVVVIRFAVFAWPFVAGFAKATWHYVLYGK